MTPDIPTQPGDNAPPIIQTSVPPRLQEIQKRSAPRQLLGFVLSLCLALFVADAFFSLGDDTLLLFLNVHFLTPIRGLVVTFAVLVALVVYILIGVSPAVPKRFFLPVTIFTPVALLLSIPAFIYFYSKLQLVGWLISVAQVVMALLIVRSVQGGWKLRWPLVAPHLVEGPLFSWRHLLTFCVANIVVVLPAVVAYLAICSSVAVNHFSEGFVALRRAGFTVQVRKYVRADGKSILLVPMSHVGEPEFYRSLSQSFPTNATILMEGVTDEKELLTNHITYKRMANTLGLAQQQREFKPSPVRMVMADIDVDEFAPSTIDFLNVVMLIHSKGLTVQNLLLLMQSSGSPEFQSQVFDDILKKRNQHLLKEIKQHLPSSEGLVIPWGAAHMPEIAREIQKSGFRLETSSEFVAIRFRRNKRNGIQSQNELKSDADRNALLQQSDRVSDRQTSNAVPAQPVQ